MFRGKRFQPIKDLIPNPTEYCHLLLVRTDRRCRVIETQVNVPGLTWKDRTGFPCVVANRNDEIELLTIELIGGLRVLGANVDTDLGHHLHCLTPD